MTEEPHLVKHPAFVREDRLRSVVEFLRGEVGFVASDHVLALFLFKRHFHPI
jgi:hypothetical protein